jgi:hypothetical protein
VNCEQLDEARRSAKAAEDSAETAKQATAAALVEAATNKKRDHASAYVVIEAQYKDVLDGIDRDCTIRGWLQLDDCKSPRTPTMTVRERERWLLNLLMWMELAYVQTEVLDLDAARPWREEVQSYFIHPEICKRARERLEGNERPWARVFLAAVPPECRGKLAMSAQGAAAGAAAPTMADVKAKLFVPLADPPATQDR